LYPEALVEIHPLDAEELNIADNSVVKVLSKRGEVILRAKVTTKTTRGVVFIPFHFAEAAANLLTNDALDPEAKIPEFKACAVKVEISSEELLPDKNRHQLRGRY
jgi:predicted molibdopterin-dependent oxidoreductase YjgC